MGVAVLTRIVGGWRVKELDHCFVDVLEMMWNYRVVRTHKRFGEADEGYDLGWCYFGKTHQDFTRAVLGALLWDGADDTKPLGWDKDIVTREVSDEGRRRIESGKR